MTGVQTCALPISPLRKQFLDGEDKEIYRIVADFFRAFSDVLWKGAKPRSFIFRTVGILASFDILKSALSAGKLNAHDTYAATKRMILAVESVDLTDNFFHASGAGRVRIRNVIGVATSLISYEKLHNEVAVAQVREIISRYAAH